MIQNGACLKNRLAFLMVAEASCAEGKQDFSPPVTHPVLWYIQNEPNANE